MTVLHGCCLAFLTELVMRIAPNPLLDFLGPLSLIIIGVTAYVLLLVCYPYLRTTFVASWLSPLTAWTIIVLLTFPSHDGSGEKLLAVAFFTAIHTVGNFIVSAATFPVLGALRRLPVRDPGLCRTCGYPVPPQASRCPECGHPHSPPA